MRNWPWYGYLLVAVIIFGLFYLIHYRPKGTELNNLRDERITLENDVRKLRQKKKELNKIEAELKKLDKTLKAMEVIIPKKEEIYDILKRMQQIASDSRLTIVKFDPKKWINKEFHAERPIEIEIIGNYHNLGTFFSRLSRLSRLFNVEGFTLKALRRQENDSTITANWTAKAYIFLEKSKTPPAKKKRTPRKGARK